MNLPSSACDPELKPADTKTCTDQPVCRSLKATTTSTTTSTTTLAPTALVISRTSPTKKRRVKTTPPEPSSSATSELENKNYMESYSSRFPESYPTDYDSEAYFEGKAHKNRLPFEINFFTVALLPLVVPWYIHSFLRCCCANSLYLNMHIKCVCNMNTKYENFAGKFFAAGHLENNLYWHDFNCYVCSFKTIGCDAYKYLQCFFILSKTFCYRRTAKGAHVTLDPTLSSHG